MLTYAKVKSLRTKKRKLMSGRAVNDKRINAFK